MIGNTNGGGAARFSLESLEKLGTRSFRSENQWVPGTHTFEGVPFSTLLKVIGAKGTKLQAIALNDYSVTIPIQDLTDSPALLVTKMDGEYMSIRKKGPLWILYPQGPGSEKYMKAPYVNYMIWQLKTLDVQ